MRGHDRDWPHGSGRKQEGQHVHRQTRLRADRDRTIGVKQIGQAGLLASVVSRGESREGWRKQIRQVGRVRRCLTNNVPFRCQAHEIPWPGDDARGINGRSHAWRAESKKPRTRVPAADCVLEIHRHHAGASHRMTAQEGGRFIGVERFKIGVKRVHHVAVHVHDRRIVKRAVGFEKIGRREGRIENLLHPLGKIRGPAAKVNDPFRQFAVAPTRQHGRSVRGQSCFG